MHTQIIEVSAGESRTFEAPRNPTFTPDWYVVVEVVPGDGGGSANLSAAVVREAEDDDFGALDASTLNTAEAGEAFTERLTFDTLIPFASLRVAAVAQDCVVRLLWVSNARMVEVA